MAYFVKNNFPILNSIRFLEGGEGDGLDVVDIVADGAGDVVADGAIDAEEFRFETRINIRGFKKLDRASYKVAITSASYVIGSSSRPTTSTSH